MLLAYHIRPAGVIAALLTKDVVVSGKWNPLLSRFSEHNHLGYCTSHQFLCSGLLNPISKGRFKTRSSRFKEGKALLHTHAFVYLYNGISTSQKHGYYVDCY